MLTVVETHRNRGLTQDVASPSSSLSSQNRPETERDHLIDALSDLHNLLEDFSPSWYTERYRNKAEAALPRKKKS